MGKQLDRKEQDSHWLDGDWEHTLPDDFEFPDLSRFTFVSVLLFYFALVTLILRARSFVSGTKNGFD